MRGLLCADGFRIRHSKGFWIVTLALLVLSGIVLGARANDAANINDGLWITLPVVALAQSVWIPVWTGNDEANGLLRNKLIVGKTRSAVFLTYALTSLGITLWFEALFLLVQIGIGSFMLEAAPIGTTVLVLTSALVALAFFFTLVSVCPIHKTTRVILCLLGLIALFLVAFQIQNRLIEPPKTLVLEQQVNGEMVNEPVLNPKFLDGNARAVAETALSWLPTGAMMQLVFGFVCPPVVLAIQLFVEAIVFIGAGWLVFTRKEVR